jgi:hypothetical protein
LTVRPHHTTTKANTKDPVHRSNHGGSKLQSIQKIKSSEPHCESTRVVKTYSVSATQLILFKPRSYVPPKGSSQHADAVLGINDPRCCPLKCNPIDRSLECKTLRSVSHSCSVVRDQRPALVPSECRGGENPVEGETVSRNRSEQALSLYGNGSSRR